MSIEFQILQDGKSLEMDGGDGRTTIEMYLIAELYTLRWLR